MSKTEIIAELAHLSPQDLAEVRAWLDRLADKKASVSRSHSLCPQIGRMPSISSSRLRSFLPMPEYDGSLYDPPAPIAIVTLRRFRGEGPVEDVSLLIDTGADITLLPRSAITRLGISPNTGMRFELIGFDGTHSTAQAVDLDMIFLNKSFRGQYLVSDGEHGILGRDVLAALRLTFDGPAQEWTEVTE
jgi:hypothetical protein